MPPSSAELSRYSDKYFVKTRDIIHRFGDCRVTYAVFMRRPVLFTPRLAIEFLQRIAAERDVCV